MKHLIVIVLFFTQLTTAQSFFLINKEDTIVPTFLFIGTSIGPSLSTQYVRNIEELTAIPNLNISYGNKLMNIDISIGVISRVGFIAMSKWTYSGFYYTINSIDKGFVEHGPEITTGFNCFFGKKDRFRFYAGSSIGMTFKNGNNIKEVLRPIVIGLSFNLLSERKDGN